MGSKTVLKRSRSCGNGLINTFFFLFIEEDKEISENMERQDYALS